MSSEEFGGIHLHEWNRKFLKSFWYGVCIATVGEVLNLAALGMFTAESLLHSALLPAGVNTLTLGLVSWIYRRFRAKFHYLVILALTIVTSSYIAVHADVDYIQSLLLLPIMFSTFYYKRGLVIFACCATIAMFWGETWIHPVLRERTNPSEWVSMPTILLVAAWIALSVMERGIELLQELGNESKDKQNLMIQNVIKDKMVRTDTLTGLYNRAALFEHLEMLLRYTESEGFSMHVAMIDIDHFKSVNDTFGHHIGDIVLKRVSAAIRDGIDPGDFAARYGGEEFTAVFTDRMLQDVYRTLERIRQQVEDLEHPELDGRSVTVSIGLHPYSKGMDKEHLLGQADACLYQAKRTGRNKIVSH